MLEAGTIVAGKFRIERVLGQGGMAIVAVATHLALDQKIALKVVHERLADQPSVIERFLREARAVARLARTGHATRGATKPVAVESRHPTYGRGSPGVAWSP